MKKNLIVMPILISVLGLFTACSSGGARASKSIFPGIEECCSVYFDQWVQESEDSGYMPENAMDLYKEAIYNYLAKKAGTEVSTTVTQTSGIVLDAPFIIDDDLDFGIGKSNIVPYVDLTAKVSNTGKEIGYIGRDGKGIPIFAGKATPKDGTVTVGIRFDIVGKKDYTYPLHKALGSVACIEIMSADEFDNHVIQCTGPSYVFKGVAKIKFEGKIADIPETLPGLYNKQERTSRIEEGPEDDYTINEMILSQDDKQVAVVTFSEEGIIHIIKITSPEMFLLEQYYNANHSMCAFLTLHCATDPILVAGAKSIRTYVEHDPETYLEVPALGLGIARFQGFDVKDWQSYGNRRFEKGDILPDSHFTEITLQNRY